MKNLNFLLIATIVFVISAASFVAQQDGVIRFRNADKWKVGDALIYSVENAYTKGEVLYSIRQVTYDTGDAFWICGEYGYSNSPDISSLQCNTVQQDLIRKSDGVAIKSYSGVSGFSNGPFKNYWFVDSETNTQLTVPFGAFNPVLLEKGRFYPYGGQPVINPLNPTVLITDNWYAEGLPMDGLIQRYIEQGTPQDPKPLIYRLVQVIHGSGKNPGQVSK